MDPILWSDSKIRPFDPEFVIWNLSNRLTKPTLLPGTLWEQKRFNYCVFDCKPAITANLPEKYFISLQKKTENGKTTIIMDEPTEWLRILLHTPSTNAEQPVRVEQRRDKTWSRELTVSTNQNLVDEVLQARSDPNQLYTAMIYFEKDSGQVWQVKVAHSLYDGGAEKVLSTLIPAT